jgi:hypothetical protein
LLVRVVSAVGSLSSEVVARVIVASSALSASVPHGRTRAGVLSSVVSVVFVVTTITVVATVAVVSSSSVEAPVVFRAVDFDMATLQAKEASTFSHLLLFFAVEFTALSAVILSTIVSER